MKYRSSLKKICPLCRFVTRSRRVFVVCENKRHKQKQYFRPIKARSLSTLASEAVCGAIAAPVSGSEARVCGVPQLRADWLAGVHCASA